MMNFVLKMMNFAVCGSAVQGAKDQEFCIQNHEFCVQSGGFCIKNDEFCGQNDELCIKNDEFGHSRMIARTTK